VVPRQPRNCKNLLPVKSKMADGAQIFNIGIPYISRQAIKLETSNLVHASNMKSNFDGMQKLGQRGCDPVYATYILNLRTPVNISRI